MEVIDDVACVALRARSSSFPDPAPEPTALSSSGVIATAHAPPIPESTVVAALLQASVPPSPMHLRPHPSPQRLQAAEHAAAAAAFQENLANTRADTSRDRMQQAESQLQLRVQELGSVREALAEVQAAAAAVTSDRDALRQALSNQDKAMQAMKAYVGSIAAAPAPAAPAPPPAMEHPVDASGGRGGSSQQVLEALEAQLKAAKQARAARCLMRSRFF